MYIMLKTIELPQYIDVLLILDETSTKARIYKVLARSQDYLTKSLRYLKAHDIITISKDRKDSRLTVITLTPKGKDVQNILIALYNMMGLQK
jgi:DNA-binding MarR family transcriptional regulator